MSYPQPWDAGVTWFTRVAVEPTKLTLTTPYLRDSVLRVTNGEVEDSYIEALSRAATRLAERETNRAIPPQTIEQVLSGFPCAYIELQRPPFIELSGVSYYDADGTLQELGGSPLGVQVVESGTYQRARILPLDGTTFPATQTRKDAVTVTYRAGFDAKSYELDLINVGISMIVAELYKQRSLSVAGTSVVPSVLGLKNFLRPV